MSKRRTAGEIADTIDAFLNGTCGDRDWDNLCSIEIDDPDLDEVRLLCAGASFTYPATEPADYCNSEGREYLRNLARKLRRGERPVG